MGHLKPALRYRPFVGLQQENLAGVLRPHIGALLEFPHLARSDQGRIEGPRPDRHQRRPFDRDRLKGRIESFGVIPVLAETDHVDLRIRETTERIVQQNLSEEYEITL